MPKNSRDFPETLNFGTTLETRRNMMAMGYLQGSGGEIASAARNCLDRGFRAWLAALSPQERAEFDQIMERVRLMVPDK